MALDPKNYGLNYDWQKYAQPQSESGGTVGTLSRLGKSALGGAAAGGPIGAAGGLVLGAIGEGMRGASEEERARREEEERRKLMEFREREAARGQFNTERTQGMQGLGYLDSVRGNANRNRALLTSDMMKLRR